MSFLQFQQAMEWAHMMSECSALGRMTHETRKAVPGKGPHAGVCPEFGEVSICYASRKHAKQDSVVANNTHP